jgi:hypothetical protein
MKKALKILCIPDTQCKAGLDFTHLKWAGKYIVDKKPDVIVHMGDHWDMPSLSSHDKPGSKYFEGKRYLADIKAGNQGMDALLKPLRDEQARQRRNKEKVYKPRMVFLMGNHEDRITRAVNSNPMLEGLVTLDHLDLKEWEVHGFLNPVFIADVGFNHYWPVGAMGRPAGTASAIISKLHMSCVAGHQQGRQVAYGKRADGSPITAIIAGSFYAHDEHYMDVNSNRHWRGITMLHRVQNGSFDECFIGIDYLKEKYASAQK